MYPILARTEAGFIYSYSILLAMGIVGSFGTTVWLFRSDHVWRRRIIDALLITMTVGLIGGRVDFVLTHNDYFSINLSEIVRFDFGGYGYYGAVWGSLLGLSMTRLLNRNTPTLIFRALWISLCLLHLVGWSACLLEGCAYGRETFLGLWSADLPDAYGVYAVRYQTQLFGIMGTVIIATIFWRLIKNLRRRFWLTLLTLECLQGILAFWRGDTNVQLSIVIVSLTFSLAIWLLSSTRPPNDRATPRPIQD